MSKILFSVIFPLILLKYVKTLNSILYISTVVILGYGDNLIYFEFLTLKRLDRGVSFFVQKLLGIKNSPLFYKKTEGEFLNQSELVSNIGVNLLCS